MTAALRPEDVPRRSAGLPTTVLVAMVLFGFTLLVVAWFGASGELFVTPQLEWLLGAGLPGLAFITAGARGMWVKDLGRLRSGVDRLQADVHALHEAFASEFAEVHRHDNDPAHHVVAVSAGSTYHRPDCPILDGKTGVTRLTNRQRSSGDRTPCRRCDPEGHSAR